MEPHYRQAFWTPFVVDYQGERFGKYPPGWPAWLSLGVRLSAPWLINGLLATATGSELTQKLRAEFKDRTCWELDGIKLEPCKQ
jgi:hypothetical protein